MAILIVLFAGLLFTVPASWSAPVNLALHKHTHQSSIAGGNFGFDSAMGVDGKKYDSSMFMTELETDPWWEVDLGSEKQIDNVTLYNRVGCCRERALHVAVLLSSDGENYRLILDNDLRVFRNKRIDIGGLPARFVRVQLPGRQQLHLQEVEVYQWGTWNPPSQPAEWRWINIPKTDWTPISSNIDLGSQLAGTWNWVSGQILIIRGDGTHEVYSGGTKINEGTWRVLDAGRRQVRFTHRSGGWVDTVILSADGCSLDGTNNVGAKIHGSR